MRAQASLLALASLLVLAGCGTVRDAGVLSPAESDLAEAVAHYGQGLIAEEEFSPDTALREFQLAAEREPTNITLQLKIAAGLLGRREYAQAAEVLESSKRLSPNTPQIRLLLGLAYQAAGRFDRADREYRAVIRLLPRKSEGYVRLAASRLAQNRLKPIYSVLDHGLERVDDPLKILEFYEALGRLCLIGNQAQDAAACFERIRDRQPDNVPIREMLARAYAVSGSRPRAAAELEEVVKRQPDNWQNYFFLGELCEEAGETAKAEAFFLKASQIPPPQVSAFLRLAHLQLRADPAKALKTLQLAADQLPSDPAIRTYLGLVYSRLGRFAEAVAEFRKIEAAMRESKDRDKSLAPLYYFWYGSACEQAGLFADGERLLETCVELYPDAHEALNYLAYTWAEKGIKLDRALEYVTRALALAPKEGAYLDTLAWIHYKRGGLALALEQMRKACELLPEDATVLDHMGDVLSALKRDKEALVYWTRSFLLDPANGRTADKLQQRGVNVDQLRKTAAATPKKKI